MYMKLRRQYGILYKIPLFYHVNLKPPLLVLPRWLPLRKIAPRDVDDGLKLSNIHLQFGDF